MDMEIVKPAAVVGVVAAAAIVMLAVSFVRLAKFKGFRESFPWLLFAPMPITKAMYMLILAVIAARPSAMSATVPFSRSLLTSSCSTEAHTAKRTIM